MQKFFADRGPHLAAMIAYFALLSFVPLTFLSLALLGLTGRADELAQAAGGLLAAADAVKTGASALTQLEVATGEGSVFVVRAGKTVIAATTGSNPTAGLVFYDLKSALRTVKPAATTAAAKKPAAARKKTATSAKKKTAARKPATRKKPDAS